MDFFLSFGLFSTYVHGKKRLGLLYRKIGSGRHVPGVSTLYLLGGNSPYRWNGVGSCESLVPKMDFNKPMT